jgi:hypothetical protein
MTRSWFGLGWGAVGVEIKVNQVLIIEVTQLGRFEHLALGWSLYHRLSANTEGASAPPHNL